MFKRRELRLPDKEYIDIANMQLEKAKQLLSFIPEHINIGDYATAINRSYYAAFHSLKALEALSGYDSKKHSGTLSYFRREYIKTHLLSESLSDIIEELKVLREDSDYNITIQFNLQIATDSFEKAKIFVSEIEKYIKEETKQN